MPCMTTQTTGPPLESVMTCIFHILLDTIIGNGFPAEFTQLLWLVSLDVCWDNEISALIIQLHLVEYK